MGSGEKRTLGKKLDHNILLSFTQRLPFASLHLRVQNHWADGETEAVEGK